jgi:hypothetical protein
MIRIVWIATTLLAAACPYDARELGNDARDARSGDGPGTADARIDANPSDPCTEWTFTPAELDVCGIPGPDDAGWDAGLIDIGSGDWKLDGGSGVLTDGVTMIDVPHLDVGGVSVVSVDHLIVSDGATLRGIGTLPLAIVSWGSIDISGTLDVSSVTGDMPGPGAGANSPNCRGGAGGPQDGAPSNDGDGGGGGGGFGDAGGAGGNGEGGLAAGGAGGLPHALADPPLVEGGCAGADSVGASGVRAQGGDGGGGILLVARLDLVVTGVIHAGGAGGEGATLGDQGGGGGGGSGGMIKLEAGSVTIDASAVLAANGAQGGGGNDNNDALPGQDGQPDLSAATSNNNEGMGTDGGDGGVLGATIGESALQSTRGGGGGGGGVGYIVYRGHPTTLIGAADITPEAAEF